MFFLFWPPKLDIKPGPSNNSKILNKPANLTLKRVPMHNRVQHYFSRVLVNMGSSPKLVTRAEAISQHGCALEFASEVPAILLWKVSSMLWYSFIILWARLQYQRCYLGMLTHTGRRFGKIVKSFGRQFTTSRNFSGVLSSTPCASVSKCSEFLDLGMMSVHGTCNFKPVCLTGDVQFSHTIRYSTEY